MCPVHVLKCIYFVVYLFMQRLHLSSTVSEMSPFHVYDIRSEGELLCGSAVVLNKL